MQIYLDPNIYFGAKETPWEGALVIEPTNPECRTDEEIECVYNFDTAFTSLNDGTVPALIMSIPAFLTLKDETEVYEGDEMVLEGTEQVTVFND